MEVERFVELWGGDVKQFPGEFYLFLKELEKIPHKKILEIGVSEGGTIKYWSEIADCVIGIDLKIKDFPLKDNMILIEGDSCQVEGSVTDRDIDMVFIDGCHDYDAVLQDYEIYSEFVKPGGMIAFHDIDWSGAHELFYDLPQEKHFVDTSTVLPDEIAKLRCIDSKHDKPMVRTNTLGWVFK